MASPAANRRKGSAFENRLRDGLRGWGYDVERSHLNGKDDEGDLLVRLKSGIRLVIEAKSGALHPTDFLRQLDVEVENYKRHRDLVNGVVGAVFCKMAGKPAEDGFVILRTMDYMALLDMLEVGDV